jgi:hypothetical protein
LVNEGLANNDISSPRNQLAMPDPCDNGLGQSASVSKRANIRPTKWRTTLAFHLHIRRSAWRSTVRHPEDAGRAQEGAAKPKYPLEKGKEAEVTVMSA